MMLEWLRKIGISRVDSVDRVTRKPDLIPVPKIHTPTFLDRFTAPLKRKTFEPVRHPDDPGNWRYPLQEAAFEQTAEDRHRLTDWLNNPRTWRRLR